MTEDRRFDRRVVERNIQRGVITRDEYQTHLDSLSDTAANAAVIDAAGLYESSEAASLRTDDSDE